jgi:hypothetical protein
MVFLSPKKHIAYLHLKNNWLVSLLDPRETYHKLKSENKFFKLAKKTPHPHQKTSPIRRGLVFEIWANKRLSRVNFFTVQKKPALNREVLKELSR